jgi:hypothetical protein
LVDGGLGFFQGRFGLGLLERFWTIQGDRLDGWRHGCGRCRHRSARWSAGRCRRRIVRLGAELHGLRGVGQWLGLGFGDNQLNGRQLIGGVLPELEMAEAEHNPMNTQRA